MLLFNALLQIQSQAGSIARRPNGTMLSITDRCKLVTFNSGKPYRWTPSLRALLADDWEVISLERLIDETNQMAAMQAEAEALETESNG